MFDYDVFFGAMVSCVMLFNHGMPGHVMVCYVMQCYVILCYVVWCRRIPPLSRASGPRHTSGIYFFYSCSSYNIMHTYANNTI